MILDFYRLHNSLLLRQAKAYLEEYTTEIRKDGEFSSNFTTDFFDERPIGSLLARSPQRLRHLPAPALPSASPSVPRQRSFTKLIMEAYFGT